MIVLGEQCFGLRDHYKVYNVLKDGGFIKLPNGMGLLVELKGGYAVYKLVAVGEEISNNVLFNMQTFRPKKPKKVKVPKKKEIVVNNDGLKYEEGGLFD